MSKIRLDNNQGRLREGVYDCGDLYMKIASSPSFCRDSLKDKKCL